MLSRKVIGLSLAVGLCGVLLLVLKHQHLAVMCAISAILLAILSTRLPRS